MAAVLAPMEEVEKILAAFPSITSANLNAPKQTVISGTRDDIAKAIAWGSREDAEARGLLTAELREGQRCAEATRKNAGVTPGCFSNSRTSAPIRAIQPVN